jgi:hypothetical protein
MFPECPAFSSWNISGGQRSFDAPPSTVGWEADHGIPNPGAGAAAFAGRVRAHRWAERYRPAGVYRGNNDPP